MAGSPSPDLGDAGDFFEQLQARVDVVQALLLEEGADYPKLLAELEKLQELRREHEEQLAIEAQADEYDDTTPLSSSTPSHAMEVHHDHGGVDGSHELTHEQEELMFLEALAAQIANVDQQEEAREEEEEEEEGSDRGEGPSSVGLAQLPRTSRRQERIARDHRALRFAASSAVFTGPVNLLSRQEIRQRGLHKIFPPVNLNARVKPWDVPAIAAILDDLPLPEWCADYVDELDARKVKWANRIINASGDEGVDFWCPVRDGLTIKTSNGDAEAYARPCSYCRSKNKACIKFTETAEEKRLRGVKVDKDHNACRACKKQNGKCSGRPLRKGPCDEFFVWLFKRLAQRNPRGAWFECDPYVTLKKDFNKETGLQVFDSAQQTFDITAAALAAARATAPAPAPAAPTTAPAASGSSSVSRRRRRHDAAENRRNGKKRAGGANDYNSDEDSIHGQAGDSDEE